MDTPNIKKYERFVLSWHKFLKRWEHLVVKSQNEQERKQYAMYLLMQFFNKPYDIEKDFYPQFYSRLEEAKEFI